MRTTMTDAFAFIGRVLIAAMFVYAGYGKIGGFEGTAGYIASKGLPLSQLLAAGTIALEIVAGVMLVVGWKARWAALRAGAVHRRGERAVPQLLGLPGGPVPDAAAVLPEEHGDHRRPADDRGVRRRTLERRPALSRGVRPARAA